MKINTTRSFDDSWSFMASSFRFLVPIRVFPGSKWVFEAQKKIYIYILFVSVSNPCIYSQVFCNFLYFLRAYTIYYHSGSRIPMEAALEIVNQTFVSILSGNFIRICTGSHARRAGPRS